MRLHKEQFLIWLISVALLLLPLTAVAQGTRITPPKNNYAIADDVKIGQQAAAQVERQLPTLSETSEVDDYVERVGRRLVAAIPREFQHPGFNYQFNVVNAREINAFALPGGPMYVNRGMIEAARNEGEMAGVMAHEISHVALRHGTAQATKAQSGKVQLGALGGAILGAIIGGNVGGVIAQGTQIGLSAYLLKFSREYENQADILGAQIMARAGYDPRDLANMFRTIERQSGASGGPEWLSSHPNPGNRYQRINQEAELLGSTRAGAAIDNREFSNIQARLRGQSRAPSMEEIARNQERMNNRYPDNSRIEQQVDYPSARFRTYTGSNLFRINVPENWRDFSEQNSVTFAPRGAYGEYRGQSVFTHGAVVGVTQAGSQNLRQASDLYLNALLQNNSYLRLQRNYRAGTIDGRQALMATLTGSSPVTGQTEIVSVYTTLLDNGLLFYIVNVAPRDQYQDYERVFQSMLRSVELFA